MVGIVAAIAVASTVLHPVETTSAAAAASWRAPVSTTIAMTQTCADVAVFKAGQAGDIAVEAVIGGVESRLIRSADIRVIQLADSLTSADVLIAALAVGAPTTESDMAILEWKSVASAWQGVISDAVTRCGETVVLVGFGESAMVAQWALAGVQAPENVGGIVLIGNPGRALRLSSDFFGSTSGDAFAADGAAVVAAEAGIVSLPELSADAVEALSVEACARLDYLCDTSAVALQRPDYSTWLASSAVTASHSTYGTNASSVDGTELMRLGGEVAHRLDGLDDQTREQLEFTANQHVTASFDLTAALANRPSSAEWRNSPSSTAPESLVTVLTPGGSLVATSSDAGTYVYRVEHRVRGGVWVPVTLWITVLAAAPPVSTRGSVAAFPPASSQSASRQQCADVLFVGVRGSGQTAGENAGYGPEVAAVRDGIRDGLADSISVREIQLDYVAAPVSQIASSAEGRFRYLDSIDDGVEKLASVLIDSLFNCPNEKWTVAGYSQGGLVARDALSAFEQHADRVAALVLLADPGRKVSESALSNSGTSFIGSGLAGAVSRPIPDSLSSRTHVICDAWDLVCDSFNLLSIPATQGGLDSMGIHTGYSTNYLRLHGLGLQFASSIESVQGESGAGYLDGTVLVDGSIKNTSAQSIQVVNRQDGGQEAFWLSCSNASDSCAIKTAARVGGSFAWSQPSVIRVLDRSAAQLTSVGTPQGRTVLAWTVLEEDPYSFGHWPYPGNLQAAQLKAMVRDAGGGWSDSEDVSFRESRSNSRLALAAGPDGTVTLSTVTAGTCNGYGCGTTSTDGTVFKRFEVALLGSQESTFGILTILSGPSGVYLSGTVLPLTNGGIFAAWEDDLLIRTSFMNASTGVWSEPSELEDKLPIGSGESYGAGLRSVTENGLGQPVVLIERVVSGAWYQYNQNSMATLSSIGSSSIKRLPVTYWAGSRSFERGDQDVLVRSSSPGPTFMSPSYLNDAGWMESAKLDYGGFVTPWAPVSMHTTNVRGIADEPNGYTVSASGHLVAILSHRDGAQGTSSTQWTMLGPSADAWTVPRDILPGAEPGLVGVYETTARVAGDGIMTLAFVLGPLTSSAQLRLRSFDPDETVRPPRPISVTLAAVGATESLEVGQLVNFYATASAVPAPWGGGTGANGYFELVSGTTVYATSPTTNSTANLTVAVPRGGISEFTAVWHPLDNPHIATGISSPISVSAIRSTPTVGVTFVGAGATGIPENFTIDVDGGAGLPIPQGSVVVSIGAIQLDPVALNANGSASVPVPQNLAPGTYAVAATYLGDGAFVAATSLVVRSIVVAGPLAALSPSPLPVVSGVVQVGAVLSVDVGVWGPDPVVFGVQWFADGLPIVGQTGSSLTLTSAEVNRTITVEVTGSRSGYTPLARTSLPTGPVAPVFADVAATHTFSTQIEWMKAQDISNGYNEPSGLRTYRPEDAVTRQAMAAFLYRLAGSPSFAPPEVSTFADVPASHPFYLQVEWMRYEGITTGSQQLDGSVLFRPGEPVSRQAMSAFLYRFAESPVVVTPEIASFSDVSNGAQFYQQIEWMKAASISTGYNDGSTVTFRPTVPVSRQAMAAFLYRFSQ